MTEPDHNHAVEIVEQRVHAVQAPPNVHPLVAAAMASKDIDIAKLKELLAMQSEYEAREARKSYTMALADLKRDLPPVIWKDAGVDFTHNGKQTLYRHASLANVLDQVNEPLARHGFALSWRPATVGGKIQVTCRLTHQGGHHEEVMLEAPPDTSGSKSSAQAIASTITLLSRYSALSLLGLATGDMPEPTGEGAPSTADASAVVNTELNLRAAGWLGKKGVPVPEAEALLGRRVSDWTAGDLEKIKQRWGTKAAPAQQGPAPKPPAPDGPAPAPTPADANVVAGPSAATAKRLCDLVRNLHGKGADPAEELDRVLGSVGIRVLEDVDEKQAQEAIRRFELELKEMLDEGRK